MKRNAAKLGLADVANEIELDVVECRR